MIILEEYIFTDEQWKKIEKYLPKRKTGSTWRTLLERFGKWQSVHQCFSCWSKEGIFENIFSEASKAADTSEISIDSTFVKVHQHALSGLKKETV